MFVKRKLPSRNKILDSNSGKFKPAIAQGLSAPEQQTPSEFQPEPSDASGTVYNNDRLAVRLQANGLFDITYQTGEFGRDKLKA